MSAQNLQLQLLAQILADQQGWGVDAFYDTHPDGDLDKEVFTKIFARESTPASVQDSVKDLSGKVKEGTRNKQPDDAKKIPPNSQDRGLMSTARQRASLPKKTSFTPVGQLVQTAQELAANCRDAAEIENALHGFSGCPLQRTATNLVFADGTYNAPVMLIGEAPGAEEDRQGKPFVGASGQLLDLMLSYIGLARSRNFLISNVIFWRPPGNRQPSTDEIATCLPFIERLIIVTNPKVIILAGGTASKALLGEKQGITKLQGRWWDHQFFGLAHPIPVVAMYHPAYLLRQPAQKRAVWRTCLAIRQKLNALGLDL